MTAVTRTTTGPVVEHDAEIVERRDEGLYHRLVVRAPTAAARAIPGQFITLEVPAREHILPRPFSIAGADSGAGTIDVLFAEVGQGTQGLERRARVGDHVRLVGPLGTGFTGVEGPAVAVGGGYGAAPLTWLAATLPGDVDLVVGAATAQRLCLPVGTDVACRSVRITTDDGSRGTQGRVTDVLADAIAEAGAQRVYACGPMPMLRAVEAVAAEVGVPCELATEEHMACGVGVCMTCVIPLREATGEWHHRRVCVEGPVVAGGAIVWEATRW